MTSDLPIRLGLCILWLLTVGAGGLGILRYQNNGGPNALTPEHWPTVSQLSLDSQCNTLIMFAQPRCPCTRASLQELHRLLSRYDGKVNAHVLFFQPSKFSDEGWTRTGSFQSAAAIPGVMVQEDIDGRQARQFGAETSGFVVLYDPRGHLLFRGGITSGRGKPGDNAGASAIAALLAGKAPVLRHTLAYGCPLTD